MAFAIGASLLGKGIAGGAADSVFTVRRVGQAALNIAAGAMGGAAGNVAGQLATNKIEGASLTTGLGFAAVSGFAIGGLGSAIGEGATRSLSREPILDDEIDWHNKETATKMQTEGYNYTPKPFPRDPYRPGQRIRQVRAFLARIRRRLGRLRCKHYGHIPAEVDTELVIGMGLLLGSATNSSLTHTRKYE